jgi:hypothetical protein
MMACDCSGVSHWKISASSPASPAERHDEALRCVELLPVAFASELRQLFAEFSDRHASIPTGASGKHSGW